MQGWVRAMTATLSRRGLLRGLIGQKAADPADPQTFLARISEACVEAKGVSCRRCGEACDADAIRFKPIGGGKAQALLSAGQCTGCGACLSVCPVNAIALVSTERQALVAGLVEMGARS